MMPMPPIPSRRKSNFENTPHSPWNSQRPLSFVVASIRPAVQLDFGDDYGVVFDCYWGQLDSLGDSFRGEVVVEGDTLFFVVETSV